jgi:hypothetical protein
VKIDGSRVIEQHSADRREPTQIVFVRDVIAVPGHHVERRMPDLGPVELTAPLHD